MSCASAVHFSRRNRFFKGHKTVRDRTVMGGCPSFLKEGFRVWGLGASTFDLCVQDYLRINGGENLGKWDLIEWSLTLQIRHFTACLGLLCIVEEAKWMKNDGEH